MICYQDEKMYGPPVNGMTAEMLDEEIRKLENEIYGDRKNIERGHSEKKAMIFDVKLGKLVERKNS